MGLKRLGLAMRGVEQLKSQLSKKTSMAALNFGAQIGGWFMMPTE